MNLTKSFAAVLFITTLLLAGCKSKSAKELIVNKWKITNIKGGDADLMPDSIRTEIYSSANMEFTKDGKFMVSMLNNKTTGTYSVSDDGKKLTTTDGERKTPEIADILEISADKFIISSTKDKTTITFVKK